MTPDPSQPSVIARLRALVEKWREEVKALRSQADWMDGCNGRPFDPETRALLRNKADHKSEDADELEAAALLAGEGAMKMPCPHCGLFGNHLSSCEYEKFKAAALVGEADTPPEEELSDAEIGRRLRQSVKKVQIARAAVVPREEGSK